MYIRRLSVAKYAVFLIRKQKTALNYKSSDYSDMTKYC